MGRTEAVLFDLLSGLIDSWELWDTIAGDSEHGRVWRRAYLELTYATGKYEDFEALIDEAALNAPVHNNAGVELVDRWDELAPWEEAGDILNELQGLGLMIGVVTNCSQRLGERAADRIGVDFDVVSTAERAGEYKPNPGPYTLAIDELDVRPEHVLFVSGSGRDIPGARQLGMRAIWHNRIGLAKPDEVTNITTIDTLNELLDYLD